MRIHRNFIVFSVFFGLAASLYATIGAGLQMQTGNPSGATADAANHTGYLVDRAQYVMDYNDTTREPNWVSWDLTKTDVGSSGRSSFIVDTTLPAGFYQVLTTDYSGSGYDRGHMCPSADRTVTAADNQVVFYMSNMVPQAPDNNQGVWASFETYCRTLASADNEVLIITGPSGFAGSTIASGVGIPGYTWKIAVVVPPGDGSAQSRITSSTRVIAIKIPNIAGVRSNPWQQYVTKASQIEADTGLKFFTALPNSIATALREVVDGQSSVGSPVITTQPTGQLASVGGSATFTVSASGDPTLLYQWIKEDVEIPGATTASLTLTNIQPTDAKTYTVVVTNGIGSITSAGAALVISGLPPAIDTPPSAHSAAAGTTTTFSVTASGSPTLTYQWRKGGATLSNSTNVAGATSATLVLSNVQTGDADSYDVVVTNSVNTATSLPALLNVTPAAPTITSAPAPQTVAVAGTAVFTVGVTGTAPFTYQWRKGGSPLSDGAGIAGALSPTLTLTNVQTGNAGNYDVVITNGVAPDATTTPVALTVNAVVAGRYSYTGGTYTQNFDTLPTTGGPFTNLTAPFDLTKAPVSASGMTGWTLAAVSGAVPTVVVGTGTANTGAVYSFGAANSTDRALGTIASGTTVPRFGLTLVNNTGETITQFTLAYVGEWWRNGGNASLAAQTLPFSYSVGASDIASTSPAFTAVAALGFTSPTPTSLTGAAVDGNAPANRVALSSTITGISWVPGQTLVLRWDDINDTGNDHGLAIDDLSFSTPVASPPPLPVAPVVVSTTPVGGATAVTTNTQIAITFNEPVIVAGSWFTINSALNGGVAATVNVSLDGKIYTLTPPTSFSDNDTITVTVFAAQILDQPTATLHPATNTLFSFTTAAPVPPSIATQPLPQTVAAGGTATFSVVAGGTPPFSYQWRKDGNPIIGNASATTSTLTVTNAQAGDGGAYDVVVSNGTNPAATSDSVGLAVTPTAPTIVTQPLPRTVATNETVVFTVAATGTAPFTYQWRKGGSNLSNTTVIGGATTATLTLTGVAVGDSGNYDVVVSNGVNPSATSTAAALTVNAPQIQVNYGGGTYAQNFDTLPSAGTFTFVGTGPFALDPTTLGSAATGLPGWSFSKYAGSGANALFKFDNGGSNAGGTNSYGTSAATDRALGSLSSGTAISRFGVTFVNTTGATITYFTLRYTGEQWRHGGSTTPNKLTFSYAVGAGDINTGTFTAFAGLDFTAPIATTTTAALDGNAAANRVTTIAGTVTGLNWAPGQTLVLRWTDVDDAGSDDGLAIDDLTFTSAPPVPVITAQTGPQAVNALGSTSFTVSVSSTTAVTYAWRRNGNPITGNSSALTATLLLTNIQGGDAGLYDCVVTNGYGPTSSNAVQLTVNKLPATVTLPSAVFAYDGNGKSVVPSTVPSGLAVGLTYNGSPTPPKNPGNYTVVGTIADPNYAGTGSGSETITITALLRHAPMVSGSLDGSVQMLTGESVALSGAAWISGDLLAPGTPNVVVNGSATYGGTLDGTGSSSPAGYSITLNDTSLLRHVVRRTDPLVMPDVAAPPAPAGTRIVSLTTAAQSAGDFATVRNLSLNLTAGLVTVPPGTYGSFSASGSSGFVLGIPNATVPSVYNFQSLALNVLPGSAQLQIVGPVIINLASGSLMNGNAGALAHPEWLTLNVAAGNLTISGNVTFNGNVVAPNSGVTLNINATLNGTVVADKLTLNGTSILNDPN